ncbi:MAG: hypothetical protein CSA38_01915 [Flavobacteriales bacterium]|nr:MAG: hypothetical protein CSA38_01915 [Flavobacteriales bacterium]
MKYTGINKIYQLIPDNTSGEISPGNLRECFTETFTKISGFVKLDASNITNECRTLLRSKLGVGDLPANLATTDDIETATENKVDKATDELRAIGGTHPYAWAFDINGNAKRVPGAELYTNVANSQVTTTRGAGMTQGFAWYHDTQGYPFYLKNLQDGTYDDNSDKKLVLDPYGNLKTADREEFIINITDTLPNPATPTQQTLTIVHQGVVTPEQLDTNILELNEFIMNLRKKDFTVLTDDDWHVINAKDNTGAIKSSGGITLGRTSDDFQKGEVFACAYPNLVLPPNKNWAFVIGGGVDGNWNNDKGFIGIAEASNTEDIGIIKSLISYITLWNIYGRTNCTYINNRIGMRYSPVNSLTFVKVGNILSVTVRGADEIKSLNIDVTGVSSFKPALYMNAGGNKGNVTSVDFGRYWIEP